MYGKFCCCCMYDILWVMSYSYLVSVIAWPHLFSQHVRKDIIPVNVCTILRILYIRLILNVSGVIIKCHLLWWMVRFKTNFNDSPFTQMIASFIPSSLLLLVWLQWIKVFISDLFEIHPESSSSTTYDDSWCVVQFN